MICVFKGQLVLYKYSDIVKPQSNNLERKGCSIIYVSVNCLRCACVKYIFWALQSGYLVALSEYIHVKAAHGIKRIMKTIGLYLIS